MLLVSRRPLVVPIQRNNGWRDDFAVTGGANLGYSIVGGAWDKLPDGIKLRAISSTTVSFDLPAVYGLDSFELETLVKLVAGTRAQIRFHYIDAGNHLSLRLNNDDTVKFVKAVSSVYTTLATITGVIASQKQCLGVRTIGQQYYIYVDGICRVMGSDADISGSGAINLSAYDTTSGVAQAEYEYVAVNPI